MPTSASYSLPEEIRLMLLPPPRTRKTDDVLTDFQALELALGLAATGIREGMPVDEAIKILEKEYQISVAEAKSTAYAIEEEELFDLTIQRKRLLQEVKEIDSKINVVKSKIKKLQKQEMAAIVATENEVQKRGRGRPRLCRTSEYEEMIKNFISKWVQAVKNEMDVQTYSALQNLIPAGDARNWLNWKNRKTIPAPKSFLQMITLKIDNKEHKHNGKSLAEIPTNPSSADLYSLLIGIESITVIDDENGISLAKLAEMQKSKKSKKSKQL